MENLSRVGAALEYERRRAKRLRAAMALLGCAVAAIVTFALMNPAISMTGDVVCGLEEHTHDASCYEAVLTCGLEEGEDHQHSDDCYEQVLSCGLEEHQHTDACYEQADAEDAEGEAPVTEDDPVGALYRAPEEDGAEAENSAALGAETPATETTEPAINDRPADAEGEAHPAQTFLENILDAEGNIALTVAVDAPAGALPAGATMRVKPVEPQAVADSVSQALLAAGADEEQAQSEGIQAVDIAFFDADGAEIEPAAKITVRLTSAFIADNDDVVLVHVPDEGEGAPELVAALDDEAIAARALQAEKTDLYFESDKFSTYALTSAPMLAAASGTSKVVRLEVGESWTPEGSASDNGHKWESKDNSVAAIVGSNAGETVEIKGVREGSTTIAHIYYIKKNKNSYNEKTETWTVTVMPAEEQSGDEEADKEYEAASDHSDNFTVTVKDTGRLKKLADYHVVVKPGTGNYALDEGESELAAYHIYLADSDGNEVQASDLLNGTLNLKVTLTYDTLPDWFNQAKDVKHFKNGAKQDITGVTTNNSSRQISFMVHGFSDFVITSDSSTTTGDGTTVTTQQGSILDGKTFNDANQWQIVSGGYVNNTSSAKTLSSDGSVRVQKNIIPTGVENEFYVYLAMDAKVTYDSMTSYLREVISNGDYIFASAAHFPDFRNGDYYYDHGGWLYDKVQGTPKPSGSHYVTFTILYKGNTIGTITLGADNSNYQVFMKLGDKYLGLGVAKQGSLISDKVELTDDAYAYLVEQVVREPKYITEMSVSDMMGDYVVFDSIVAGDYSNSTTHYIGDLLDWRPIVKKSPTVLSEGDDRWQINVAELLYKVRLDVTKDGFNSCAQHMNSTAGDGWSYKVNEKATLTYDGNKTVDFPVPYVRGLLYDLKLKKVDESGNPLLGAQFSLTGTSNTTGTDVAAAAARNIDSTQLVSGPDGYVTVTGLPWGAYTVTETVPPSGYSLDAQYASGKQATLCYTTTSNVLADNADHKILKEGSNNFLTVVNKKNSIEVFKEVKVQGEGIELGDIDHTVYFVLQNKDTGAYLHDASGSVLCKAVTIIDGVPSGEVTFGQDDTELIPSGTYDVWELSEAPAANATDEQITALRMSKGYQFGEAGHQVQVAGVSVQRYVDGSWGDGNNADLSATDTAQVKVTNTYSHVTDTISFEVNKKWVDATGQIFTPANGSGLTATLELTRASGAEGDTKTVDPTFSQSITLPVESDSPWTAVFTDLPISDNDGNQYEYRVRESSTSDGYRAYDGQSDTTPMGESEYLTNSGGSIWNKQDASITIKKTDGTNFLPGATFALYNVGSSEVMVGDEFMVNSENGVTIAGLTPGTYKLRETNPPAGYIIMDSPIEFTVAATGANAGSVVTWSGSQPANAQALTTTTYDNDTITVTNTPGTELPHTGGSGTLPYTLGGLALVAAALMYGWQLARRGRRSETQPRIP